MSYNTVAQLNSSYSEIANRIIDTALSDSTVYHRLAYMTDTFGPRFSGTKALEDAIDWVAEEMETDGFSSVYTQPVRVPRWIRGNEYVTLNKPRSTYLNMMGLGGSIGTGGEILTAPAYVVRSVEELKANADLAKGKIVIFNVPFVAYGQTVRIRTQGAVEAAKAGAVGSLIRSVGPYSMNTPHTGNSRYQDGVRKIPHAAITVEDALMLQRMQDRKQEIEVSMYMEARMADSSMSRNIIAEIKGSEHPDEVVVLGGHIDSWDVGTGAMDDGGGCLVSWEALRLIKNLGLKPRRTIRVVLWTNEENGLRGGRVYADSVSGETEKHVLAIESDSGVFEPQGFGFSGTEKAYAQLEPIIDLMEPIGVSTLFKGGGGADISPLIRKGVPGMGLIVDGSRYFWYHHTNADTIDKLDLTEMQKCTAAMAIMAFVVADMPERLHYQMTGN